MKLAELLHDSQQSRDSTNDSKDIKNSLFWDMSAESNLSIEEVDMDDSSL